VDAQLARSPHLARLLQAAHQLRQHPLAVLTPAKKTKKWSVTWSSG
jgi:hypothetical protein